MSLHYGRGPALLTCPFCGGEAAALGEYKKNAPSKTAPWTAEVVCMGKCTARMLAPGPYKCTEEQAIREAAELWNRRAETLRIPYISTGREDT